MNLNRDEIINVFAGYFKISRASVFVLLDLIESLIDFFRQNPNMAAPVQKKPLPPAMESILTAHVEKINKMPEADKRDWLLEQKFPSDEQHPSKKHKKINTFRKFCMDSATVQVNPIIDTINSITMPPLKKKEWDKRVKRHNKRHFSIGFDDREKIFAILSGQEKLGIPFSSKGLSEQVPGYSLFRYANVISQYRRCKKQNLHKLPSDWKNLHWVKKEKIIKRLDNVKLIKSILYKESLFSLKRACTERLALLEAITKRN